MTRTQSGEVVRSALDANGCEAQPNAGDSSIGDPENAEDVVKLYQASGKDTLSQGQTDIGTAPVEVAATIVDSFSWKLSSDTPEDISLDQLTYSGDLQKNIQENSAQDAPTLDTVAETGDFSADEFQGGATRSLFTN